MKAIFKRIKIHLLVVAVGLVFLSGSGCASVTNQGNYTIQVNSNSSGEICTVSKKNSGEVIFQGQTPCTVTLRPASDDYVFKVNGQESEVLHKLNPWIFANIIWGPFFGIGILIDTASGCAYEYPKRPLCFN